jgi:F-box-like
MAGPSASRMSFQLPSWLPIDIVTRIFDLVCEGHNVRLSLRSHHPPSHPHPCLLLAPVVLSQVCRGWRAIVLDASSLWSNIFIDGSDRGRGPEEGDFRLLRTGIEEVMARAKTSPISLLIRPPGVPHGQSPATTQLQHRWQAIVDRLFGLTGTTLGIRYTQIHFLGSLFGLEGQEAVDLRLVKQVTLEDESWSLHNWLFKKFGPGKVPRWPQKVIWLSRHDNFPGYSYFDNVTDLAIITPNAIVSLDGIFNSLLDLPQLVSLRMNLGYTSISEFNPQTSKTLTFPNLRTLELQNCERTFIQCLPSVHLPVLVNFDWIISGYRSLNVDVEEALAQIAPALCSMRVCYLQSQFWSTDVQDQRPVSFHLTSNEACFKSWRDSLSISRLDPVAFLSNFTSCRRSPNLHIPKVAPAYIEEIQSIPYVGHNWKAELALPDSEMQARHIQLDPADILSLKRAFKVLGSTRIPAYRRSVEVVLRYP